MECGGADNTLIEWRELDIPLQKANKISLGSIARRVAQRIRKYVVGGKKIKKEREDDRSEGEYAVPDKIDDDFEELEAKEETIQVTVTRQPLGSTGPIGVNIPEVRNGNLWWVFMARRPIDQSSEDLYIFRSKISIDPNHFLLKDLVLTDYFG